MSQLTINKPPKNHDLGCDGVTTMAEQELAAFFSAVTELFGLELAELSAEDWLHALGAIDGLPSSAREWRRITLNICTRLAGRVNALSLSSRSPTLVFRVDRQHSCNDIQQSLYPETVSEETASGGKK
jgi:hypothetical protein